MAAGAAVVHIDVRDPETRRTSPDRAVFSGGQKWAT
ncbi:hypothetical protein [Mesorhizobium sp.]